MTGRHTTAASTNATLYASSNLTGSLADEGLFPEIVGDKSRLGRHAGLLITAAAVLIVANLVDLSAIASVGSAVALVIFLLVGIAGWRRRKDTGSNPAIIIMALLITATVLAFFAVDTLENAPETFVAIIVIGVLAVVFDALGRRGRPTDASAAPGTR